MALGVVVHGTHLVFQWRFCIGNKLGTCYGVFQHLQFFQPTAVSRFPDHAVVHLQTGIHRVGKVPRIAGVVMEIFYFICFTVVVAIATMVHANPYYTHSLAEFSTAAGELRNQQFLLEVFDISCLRNQPIGTVA